MKTFRAEIHGHLIEARRGEFGVERVLLDGRVVSTKWLTGKWTSHFFELTDEHGAERQVEVRFVDVSRLGFGRYRVSISVDGAERCRLEPASSRAALSACANCGYDLRGLPVIAESGEVRCPECGRHSSARALGIEPRAQ